MQYQMKTDAMRRKVGRRSKEEIASGEKPLSADEELARQVGESVATVQRFKTLNKLVPEMQELVDSRQVPVNTGADIAQLKPEEQKKLADAIPIQSGDLYIDPTRRIVRVRDKEVSLRPREFSLLWYFVQNPRDVLTAEQICEHAWGMEGSYNRGIAQPIRLLRQAIEPDPEHPIYIETVRRVGYRFTAYKRIL